MNRDCLCRAAAVAAVVSCSERASDRVLTSASAWSRFAYHLNGNIRASVRVSEREVRANVIYLVSLREDLRTELTAEVTIRGELSHQHALVSTTQAVHGCWRHDVPTATDAVVDGEALACLEGIHPRAWNQLYASLCTLWFTSETNGHIAVVGQFWHQGDGRIRNVIWRSPTQSVLVEAGRRVQG